MDNKIKILTPQEVAEILGISKETVHAHCNEGRLSYIMRNKRARGFTLEQVQAFIESQTVHARAAKKPRPAPHSVTKGEQKDPLVEITVDRASLRKEMSQW
jgi:excisionase family DNA binding protein